MNTIFMNFKSDETFDPEKVLLSYSDKIYLINMLLYQILANVIHEEI